MNNAPDDVRDDDAKDEVVMYGSNWCPYTQRALRWMKEWNVTHRYVEVDQDPQSEELIASWNNGRAIRPTFEIGDLVLVNPDEGVLQNELRSRGLLEK